MFQRLIPFAFTLLTGFHSLLLNAQDTLILKDGSELYVKVTEIGAIAISYKKKDNPDGPTYTTDLANIFMAVYKSGKRETFSNEPSAPLKTTTDEFPAREEAKRTFSLSNKNFEARLVEVKNEAVRKNNAINVTATIDVFTGNKFFGQVLLSAYQRTDITLDFSRPVGSYWNKSYVAIGSPGKLSDLLFEKYESYNGKGYGWALPPNFFTLDSSSCCIAFLQQKTGNKEVVGFGGISSSKYNLQDCSSLENKLLSVVLTWLETNFMK